MATTQDSGPPGPPTGAPDKTLVERLLSPVADVRHGETTSVLLMTLLMFLILGGLLPAEDGPRVVHPDRGRRRGEKLLVGRAGHPAPDARAGVRRVRVAGQSGEARDLGHAVFRIAHRAVHAGRPGGIPHRHRLFSVGRHLQRDGHRPVLGVCQRPLHPGSRETAVSLDRRRQQPGRVGGRRAGRPGRQHDGADAADAGRGGRPRGLRLAGPRRQSRVESRRTEGRARGERQAAGQGRRIRADLGKTSI